MKNRTLSEISSEVLRVLAAGYEAKDTDEVRAYRPCDMVQAGLVLREFIAAVREEVLRLHGSADGNPSS